MRAYRRVVPAAILCLAALAPPGAVAKPGRMPLLPMGVYRCLRPAFHPASNRQVLAPTGVEIHLTSRDSYLLSRASASSGSYTWIAALGQVRWHSGALRGTPTHYHVSGTQPPTLLLIQPFGRRGNWLCVRQRA